jgi:hypothetical protein
MLVIHVGAALAGMRMVTAVMMPFSVMLAVVRPLDVMVARGMVARNVMVARAFMVDPLGMMTRTLVVDPLDMMTRTLVVGPLDMMTALMMNPHMMSRLHVFHMTDVVAAVMMMVVPSGLGAGSQTQQREPGGRDGKHDTTQTEHVSVSQCEVPYTDASHRMLNRCLSNLR